MTKKHFCAIMRAILRSRHAIPPQVYANLVEDMIAELRGTALNFDPNKFREACHKL